MKKFIDLHNHSIYSDGKKNIKEILTLSETNCVKILSISDHDTIEGVKDFISNDYHFNGKFIPGCELTVCYNGLPIEVLAYGFDVKKFDELTKEIFKKENELADITRANGLYKIFKSIDKDFKCLKPHFSDKFYIHHTETWKVYYAGLENEKIKREITQSLGQEAIEKRGVFFRKGLNTPSSKFYVDVSKIFPSVDKAVKIIHESNGIAVIAHPTLYEGNMNLINETFSMFDGIECLHTCSGKNMKNLIKFAKSHKKLITGGSDYHARTLDEFNCLKIPYKYWKKLSQSIKNVY